MTPAAQHMVRDGRGTGGAGSNGLPSGISLKLLGGSSAAILPSRAQTVQLRPNRPRKINWVRPHDPAFVTRWEGSDDIADLPTG